MSVPLSEEKRQELLRKYNAEVIEHCPKCGKWGILRWRRAGSHTDKYYFYVHHEDTTCYFSRLEDVESKYESATGRKEPPQLPGTKF